jgi:hypothetical protein
MFLAQLIHARSGGLVVFAVAVIALGVCFSAMAIQSQDWQEALDQLYGFLD